MKTMAPALPVSQRRAGGMLGVEANEDRPGGHREPQAIQPLRWRLRISAGPMLQSTRCVLAGVD